MNELRKNITNSFSELNQDWVKAVKEAEKDGELDLSEMFGKYALYIDQIDKYFQQARERMNSPTGKTGWFK
jgi:hypothetical protein